jgi:hypothetical protein
MKRIKNKRIKRVKSVKSIGSIKLLASIKAVKRKAHSPSPSCAAIPINLWGRSPDSKISFPLSKYLQN